jgi:SAM-dependent methyltransferase
MTERTARRRRGWDRYAPRDDRDMRTVEKLLFGGGRAWVCAQATGKTLEVGIGVGLNLPCYPAGITLTGVDLSPRMLDVARGRVERAGSVVKESQRSRAGTVERLRAAKR